MVLIRAILCVVIVSVSVASVRVHAQTTDPSVLLTQLQDPDPSVRSQAFFQIRALGLLTDQFKVALINLLATETNVVHQADNNGGSLTEEYLNYYASVIDVVGSMNDLRALGALVDVIDTGDIAGRAVSNFGSPAIDPLISKLSSNDITVRTSVLVVFDTMLQPQNIAKVSDLLSISKIAAAVTKAASDPDPYVRRSAAEDNAIIQTLTIPIDMIPPATRINLAPLPNANGWNSQDATVTLTAVDNPGGVGVKNIQATLSGAQTGNIAVAGNPANFSVTTEGVTSIGYFATDNAGNQESLKNASVRLDKTPPTVTCSVQPNVLWPPDHKLISVAATVSVSDALSGSDGFVLKSVTSSEPDNGLGDGDQPNDTQGLVIGQPSTTGLLRAERSGKGNGRTYILTYEGRDKAGNTGTCAAMVTVPKDQSKK